MKYLLLFLTLFFCFKISPSFAAFDPSKLTLFSASVGNSDFFNCKSSQYKLCQNKVEQKLIQKIKQLSPDVVSLSELMPSSICRDADKLKPKHSCYNQKQNSPNQVRRILGPDYTILCAPYSPGHCLAVKKIWGAIESSITSAGELCAAGKLCGLSQHFTAGPNFQAVATGHETLGNSSRSPLSIIKIDLHLILNSEIEQPIDSKNLKKISIISSHLNSALFEHEKPQEKLKEKLKDQLQALFSNWSDSQTATLMMGDFAINPFNEKSPPVDVDAGAISIWHQYVDHITANGQLVKVNQFHYHTEISQGKKPVITSHYPWYSKWLNKKEPAIHHVISNFARGKCHNLSSKDYLETGLSLDHTALSCEINLTPLADIAAFETGENNSATRGNLLAIQPHLSQWSYRSEYTLYLALKYYFEKALEAKQLSVQTIVTLPEFIGTWLVALNQKAEAYEKKTTEEAMTSVILSSPWNFLKNLWKLRSKRKDFSNFLETVLFYSRAEIMINSYQRIFSMLAEKYAVTLVAGSLPIPGAKLNQQGKLYTDTSEELRHLGVVFNFKGQVKTPLIFKNFHTPMEASFMQPDKKNKHWAHFQTPLGTLGVVICADSWFPEAYLAMESRGVEYIVVPAMLIGKNILDSKWQGYQGMPTPIDVDPNDVGEISEAQAWLKYSLPGRMEETQARAGQISYLRGQFWELKTDGQSLTVDDKGDIWIGPEGRQGMILNHWTK